MKHAKINIHKNADQWHVRDCSLELLEMTGFSREMMRERFQNSFLQMFSAGDMAIADEFLQQVRDAYSICPGVLHLMCTKNEMTIPVLLQVVSIEADREFFCVAIHDVSFLGNQTDEEKAQELELHRHAEQDSLTGLYNRYTTEVRCDELLQKLTGNFKAVMYMLDLDNFKHLNDTYGHVRGDEMLRQTARCMKEVFGEKALLGRLGGDELMALQMDCKQGYHPEKTAQRLCEAIQKLEVSAGIVTISVGISMSPDHGDTFTELYRCSDDALYQAKHAGKNQWKLFDQPENRISRPGGERTPVSREWLLEESSDIVYVSDFYSYDLLYLNQGARKIFGVEEQCYVGHKCYELLQGREQPCDFCTNHLLCREAFHTWKFHNKLVDRSFLLRDRIVDWYGVPARIEFATDISAMESRNRVLEDQVAIDNAIIACLRILNSIHSFDEAAEAMLKHLGEFYGATRAFILDYSPDKNALLAHCEWNKDQARTVAQLLGENGVKPDAQMQECFSSHTNYLLDGTTNEVAEGRTYRNILYDAGVACQRCVPFYIDSLPAGVIGLDNPTSFRDEMTVLETLGYFISEELSRRRLSDSLEFLSYHDSLSGLWNRNWYVKYLRGLDETEGQELSSMGIAVADINALKEVNRYRGHTQGDAVVRRTAELLSESFPEAQIFRLSGDEFVVHCESLDRLTFLDQVKQMRKNAPRLQAYGISIGFAWTDQDIDCSKLTMQATDIMMMQKQEYYQQRKEVNSVGKHDHSMLLDLMDNIRKGFFKMYLQPKADCGTFELNGAEALVRYESPEVGLILPGRFIPMLEQEHLIQYVDLFMLEEVCKLISRWQKEKKRLLTVSLNFSRQTLLEPDLLKNMLNLAEKYQVPKDLIEVEITESLGEYENLTVAEIGEGIKSAGFRLALDDFGSHYTNMAMLSSVPADVLKLDRGMVRDVMNSHTNRMVLKSILALCKELNISSIAEGIETLEQFELLRGLQCDSIQGYLFGHPAAVEDFESRYMKKK